MILMSNGIIVSNTLLDIDGRVLRQIDYFSSKDLITVFAPFKRYKNRNVKIIDISKEGKFSFLIKVYSTLMFFLGFKEICYYMIPEMKTFKDKFRKVTLSEYDYVVVNDIYLLPAVVDVINEQSSNIELIFDSHEYSLDDIKVTNPERYMLKRLKKWMFHYSIDRVNHLVSVSEEILDLYKPEIDSNKVSINLVYNQPTVIQVANTKNEKSGSVSLVHHGAANRSRRLELLLDSMRYLPSKYHLNFILIGNSKYISELKRYSSQLNLDDRVHFLKRVEPSNIVSFISRFDIFLFNLPLISKSYRYSLPNKLFEAVRAELPVVVSPNDSMKRIVDKYNIGQVADDWDAEKFASSIEKCFLKYQFHLSNCKEFNKLNFFEKQMDELYFNIYNKGEYYG